MKKVRDGRIRNTTNADARQHKRQKVGAAPPNSRRRLVSVRLLCSCLAWCFRRVGFKALFSDAQSLLVQVGLLGHVPYLRDYHRPEHQQRDRRGDGLLAEDTHPSIYRGPVCYRLYLYVQGRLHAYDGLESSSLADAHLRPPGGDVGFGNLEVLALEVIHHIPGNGGEILDDVGKGLGRVEGSHLECLLSCTQVAVRCACTSGGIFSSAGRVITAAPKRLAGEAPAGRLAPPSHQTPLWPSLWPPPRAPLLAA